jgi:hypothetical protein
MRSTTRAVEALQLGIHCEGADSVAGAIACIERSSPHVLVVDEDSVPSGQLLGLARALRAARPAAQLIVISRDFRITLSSLGEERTRHLVPKPLNVHVLAAVLGRIDFAAMSVS